MKPFEKILQDNKEWAARMLAGDPEYFNRLVKIQSPEVLWIGCSDSRVPADKITGTEPGEIFVHRNIANLVVNTDINFLSVLQYAVEILKVKHVIVCGHYGCGGVEAAMARKKYGIIDNWLKEIKDVFRLNRAELERIDDKEKRFDTMVEYNVREQIFNLAKTTIIQKAWKNDQRPQLHGWVYRLSDGIIKPVCEMDANSPIDPVYEYDNL
jgi:carbonic anhydrase